jgi:hypothetical protein
MNDGNNTRRNDRRVRQTRNWGNREGDEHVDYREILLTRFDQLDPVDQQHVLRTLLLNQKDNTPAKTIAEQTEEFALEKEKTLFRNRLYALWIVLGSFMAFAFIFAGIFVYITLKNGVLNNDGVITGLFNTIVEVLKILFGSGGAM